MFLCASTLCVCERRRSFMQKFELSREKVRITDVAFARTTFKGSLLIHEVQKHFNASLQEVPLTYAEDGFVHIGDAIMVYSAKTEGVLSVDISDRISSSDEGYLVTTSTLTQGHVARNVFIIDGYGTGWKEGDPLRLGQPFRLRVHPSLKEEPFHLFSQPVSTLASSKISRKQEVACVNVSSYDTVWIAQFKDHEQRLHMEGQPVPANAEILIKHAATGQCLSSDKKAYHNDFGLEYEVCGFSDNIIGKKQSLYNETLGTTTSDVPQR